MPTEQVGGVVSAEVDTESRRIVRTGTLGAETSGGAPEPATVIWKTRGRGRLITEHRPALAERIEDAYRDDYLEPQEQEFLDLAREHFGRLDD